MGFWAAVPPVSPVTCGWFSVGLNLCLHFYSNPFLLDFLGFALSLSSRREDLGAEGMEEDQDEKQEKFILFVYLLFILLIYFHSVYLFIYF